jgi:hypothetical protein
MPKKTYLPKKEADFAIWIRQLVTYVAGKIAGSPPAWTHIPQAAFEDLTTAYGIWNDAYNARLNNPTKGNTERKRAAHAHLMEVFRPFKGKYLDWDPVTDAERLEMGIKPHDREPTPQGRPQGRPVFTRINHEGRRSTFHVRDSNNPDKRGIPDDANGYRVQYGFANDRPASADALPNSKYVTVGTYVHTFNEEDRGKKVWFAARYENSTALIGDWSELEFFFVP